MELKPFVMPRALAQIAAALPQTPPSVVLCLALNALRERPLPAALLEALEARRLRLQVSDAGLTLDFTVRRGRFVPWFGAGEADLVIAASAYDYLCLALRKEDPDTLFFARRLLIQGDTDLGLLVKNTLDSVELPAFTLADLAPHRVLRRLAGVVLPTRFGS
ncbi:MAG: SCP2 sterol-binding domain-containing protein [Betaproteobacteria bacterium]|nr:SCP2 sterol-binding domain-containing protein [Betaproteobacteria bacterium]